MKMGFKFFRGTGLNLPTEERFDELTNAEIAQIFNLEQDEEQPINPIIPSLFLRMERNRNDISEQEWSHITLHQRRLLVDRMWSEGMIVHEITHQDNNGFTLRTELNF